MQEPGPVLAVSHSDPATAGYHMRVDCQDRLGINPKPRYLWAKKQKFWYDTRRRRADTKNARGSFASLSRRVYFYASVPRHRLTSGFSV